MEIIVTDTKTNLGKQAAQKGADLIRHALKSNGHAAIIVATGASQFEMLEELVKQNIDWRRVTGFHLDEYMGLTANHPASFRKYLKERFVNLVPLKEFHYVSGEGDPQLECKRLASAIKEHTIDVAFIGIGENAHVAFNDPPADFDTQEPYIVVELDEACRRQQMGEGWFNTFDEVPEKAISMSVQQIMHSKAIICSVPDKRKAEAVKNAFNGPVDNQFPASILQSHPNAWIYLDQDSSSLL